MTTVAADLIRQVQRSWPQWLPPVLQAIGEEVPADHLLFGEAIAILEGRVAAFPFFSATPAQEVVWVTVAPSSSELVRALADLRAWVVPSLAWEDKNGTIVTTPRGGLGTDILSLSPAGYIRWRSRADAAVVKTIAARLRRARELADMAPSHAATSVPALVELRQQLATALAAGDRLAAEEVLDTLNRHQLDTAQNALLARVRMLDHFGDSRLVVELPELDQLLRVRLPATTRIAIARAFHRVYIEPLEAQGDLSSAKVEFAARVSTQLSSLIPTLRPDDGVECLRLLAYCANERNGSTAALQAIRSTDSVVAALIPALAPVPEPPPPSDEDLFFAAWQSQDWAEVQSVGQRILPSKAEIALILRRSLEWLPNPQLRDVLEKQQIVTAPPVEMVSISPQSWSEWFSAIGLGESGRLEGFLEAQRSSTNSVSMAESQLIAEKLTDLLTAPPGAVPPAREQLVLTGLAELAGICLAANEFPSPGLLDLYRSIARCWGDWKKGSAYPPDGQVLLEFADAILQLAPKDEGALADLIEQWWKARTARALLPFMLAAVELFHRLSADGHAERLWVQAGEFVRLRPQFLTPGERLLWRRVGHDIGYDDATLAEYVPISTSIEGVDEDPIRLAKFSKIAVVSTRVEQAERAAEFLRERTDGQVVVVTARAGGSETRSAATADVIAYVWAATTHAVFRAFDKVDRRKIAYVRGTGAGSIVLAVERWAFENAVNTSDEGRGK